MPFTLIPRRFGRRMLRLESTRLQVVEGFLLIAALLIAGTFGYRYLEGWSLMDSLYMTFITLTTIGFGEIHPLSELGRVFTIGIAAIGVLAIGIIVTRTTQLLVSGNELKVRQMQRTIQKMKDHYVLCGFGRIGSRIAYNLAESDMPFVIIEQNHDHARAIEEREYLWVEGDAQEESTLLAAGLDRAKGLITTLSDDAANVFVTLTAREINPDLFILSRAYSGDNVVKLQRAGANRAVSPYELGADRMAWFVLRPKVNRFLELALQASGIDLSFEEVVIPVNSPMAGRTLRESRLRDTYNAIVVATVGPGDQISFNPGPDFVLEPGLTLIVLGQRERLKALHDEELVS